MRLARAALAVTLSSAALQLAAPREVRAQTLTDSVMMGRRQLCTGFMYERDTWSRYLEGTLERDNLNIGTVTTRSLSWMGAYGVRDRVNLIVMAPWVWTSASAGTLRGQSGPQDLTAAVKVQALTLGDGHGGALKALLVGSLALPLSDYTPDFYPLSLGSHSRRASMRGTLGYTSRHGVYLNATGGYTFRDNVTLDRTAYYTDGQLIYSDQVSMPDVYDLAFSAGYHKGRMLIPLTWTKQVTRGGGDIRRQDMPFVSNKMDASRVEASVLYYLPRLESLGLKVGAAHMLDGRNVGLSTTLQGGVFYVFEF
jgi:hypothetical protein